MFNLKYYYILLKIFFSYKRKKNTLRYFPIRFWIELASPCNLKCVMCPNKDLPLEDQGYMDMELFKKIVDEISPFSFDVSLIHRGESFLHPQLIDMIEYAKSKRLFTKIHTNGTLLDKKKSYKIIKSGLDRLSFSFDGYDKKTYEKIRVGADFDMVIENIRDFLKMKKGLGSKNPYTVIELIEFPNMDREEIKEKRKNLIKNFKGLPLDEVITKKIHNWAGYLHINKKDKNYSPCPFPWNALIVFWDGSVFPCTQDFFGEYKLGNARWESLGNIWNNEKIINLRKKLMNKEYKDISICSKCDRLWRDKLLGVPKEYLFEFIMRRMP
ncbi:MAG: radical SAM protein [Acidobacteriota bacterium]